MKIDNPIVKLTATFSPKFESIQRDIEDFRKAHPDKTTEQLAEKYGDSICWKYCSVGAASALPSTIPGLGTAAQIATEAGSISTDLALMLRWMGSMTYGIGLLYDRDIKTNFNQDYVKVLGLWCGVLKSAEGATKRVATKVAISQFNKVPGKIFQKINQKVGTTILTKYGTKRGGIAVGKLVPCGVGVLVGGSFNLATMKAFKKKAIAHFSGSGDSELYMEA